MKKLISVLCFICMTIIAAHAEDYHIHVGEFTKITVIDSIPVVYRSVPDSVGTVAFSTSREIADALIINVNKNELKLRIATDYVGRKEIPVVNVYSRFLSEVSNQTNANMQIEKPAPAPKFKANQMGNGSIEVSGLSVNSVNAKISTGNGSIVLEGECDSAKFDLVGTGTIQADNLKSDTVDCRCLGSGTIGCWPEYKLNINCLGSTKIYYKGDPTIKKRGGGKVIPIE